MPLFLLINQLGTSAVSAAGLVGFFVGGMKCLNTGVLVVAVLVTVGKIVLNTLFQAEAV